MLRARTSLPVAPASVQIAAIMAIGVLVLATGCAGGSGEPGTSSGGSSSQSAGASSGGSADASSASGKASNGTDIVVSVTDGKVDPKVHRVKVAEGSQVRLLVTTDTDDEVHVHGFEIERETSAGQPTTIEFTADQTGVFEVETHETGLLLLQLQVQ